MAAMHSPPLRILKRHRGWTQHLTLSVVSSPSPAHSLQPNALGLRPGGCAKHESSSRASSPALLIHSSSQPPNHQTFLGSNSRSRSLTTPFPSSTSIDNKPQETGFLRSGTIGRSIAIVGMITEPVRSIPNISVQLSIPPVGRQPPTFITTPF